GVEIFRALLRQKKLTRYGLIVKMPKLESICINVTSPCTHRKLTPGNSIFRLFPSAGTGKVLEERHEKVNKTHPMDIWRGPFFELLFCWNSCASICAAMDLFPAGRPSLEQSTGYHAGNG